MWALLAAGAPCSTPRATTARTGRGSTAATAACRGGRSPGARRSRPPPPVSYTHLRAHETGAYL
eukprot:1564151-Pyramimonas_sp.AAC.1